MKKTFHKSLLIWIPFALLITFTSLLTYLLVQQDLRQTANDPQVQIAEDIVQALEAGTVTPQQVLPPGQIVNIATSLDPYVIITDVNGTVLASSADLNGQSPSIPPGVFANVKQNGEDRFTWQPATGVRSAVVVDSFTGTANSAGGYVLAGRSLREVEVREDNILKLAVLAWIAGLIAMLIVVWAVIWMYKKPVASS